MFIGSGRDLLTEEIIGSFGNFKTTESQELFFLMATLRLEQLDLLSTASESLDFNKVSFEEMVQRDIDYERVDNEIIKGYLEKGSNRVIFFPPLLVSLMSFKDGEPLPQYPEINDRKDTDENVEWYFKEWGSNYFRLQLPIANVDTGYSIYCDKDKTSYNYYNYAGKLKYNPNSTKLIVIDGQHRLSALKRIADKNLLNGLKIPVCLFFSPNIAQGSSEYSKDSMRDLFVTINNTSKQVGGHFLTLLDDNSLSALIVRVFANDWKERNEGLNFLHFLEWNQRESKRSSQITRKYSLTTVSILADAIKDDVTSRRNCVTLLNLQEVDEELRKQGDSSVGEDSFTKGQVPIISEQAKKYITPSLDILLTKPKPYLRHIQNVQSAVEILRKKAIENKHGAETFYKDVFLQFRGVTQYDDGPVKDIERSFNSDIGTLSEDDQFYFRNVFQRGLIKAWSALCFDLSIEFEKTPVEIASALVEALNHGLFVSEKPIFSPNNKFTQNVIFNGHKIIANDSSRVQVSNLVLASLVKEQAKTALCSSLNLSGEQKSSFELIIKRIMNSARKDYIESYQDSYSKKLKKQFRLMDIEDDYIDELEQLERRANTGNKEDIERFHAKIDEIAVDSTDEIKDYLDSVLNARK